MATKFGSFTKRQVMRMRGAMGAKLRQEMGLTEGTAPRPKAEPGTVADRAQAGFERRMREATNANTPEKQAEAREKARRALEKYHAATTSAGKSATAAQARVNAVTGVVGPKDFEEAGYVMQGGKGGIGGRDLKALERSFGANWTTRSGMQRYQKEAAQAQERHDTMKRNYAKMYRALTGRGGRTHQLPPPKAGDI